MIYFRHTFGNNRWTGVVAIQTYLLASAFFLETLNSQRFCDKAPAQVWATLLDEGKYLASERTMYRLLAKNDQAK